MFSKNLPKHEHLTLEDLGDEAGALEQARFDYSPLSKFLNKGLKEEEKKEGPLKILKNIEGKNKQQLKAIEDQGIKQLDAIKNTETSSGSLKTIIFFSGLSREAKKIVRGAKERKKHTLDPEKLVCVKTNGTIFNSNPFKYSLDFAPNIYHQDKTSLNYAKKSQYKMFSVLNDLKMYNAKKKNKKKNLKKKH